MRLLLLLFLPVVLGQFYPRTSRSRYPRQYVPRTRQVIYNSGYDSDSDDRDDVYSSESDDDDYRRPVMSGMFSRSPRRTVLGRSRSRSDRRSRRYDSEEDLGGRGFTIRGRRYDSEEDLGGRGFTIRGRRYDSGGNSGGRGFMRSRRRYDSDDSSEERNNFRRRSQPRRGRGSVSRLFNF